MSRDVLNSLQVEVKGDDVPKLLKALHDVTEFGAECDAASKITVSYRGEVAQLFLVLEDKACGVITGPADTTRRLLLHIQGPPI